MKENDPSIEEPNPSSEPPIPEWTASELNLERARCALELERLGLEKERLETERMRLERDRELYGAASSNALRVGMGILALAAGVALVLGLLFGYSAGVESGRLQAPAPRKIVVNGAFLEALRQTPSGGMSLGAEGTESGASGKRRLPWVTLYTRPAYSESYGNLVLIR